MAISNKSIFAMCLIVVLVLGSLGGMYLKDVKESNGINSNYFRGIVLVRESEVQLLGAAEQTLEYKNFVPL